MHTITHHCKPLHAIPNAAAIRRALFKLERGVCTMCQLDCHALVAQLQAIRQGSPDWVAKRKLVLQRMAPRWAEPGGV